MMRGVYLVLLLVTATAARAEFPPAIVEQGRYLAIAGDCTACHTEAGGAPFAGGTAIATPLGAIIATNITPSLRHGIGAYTEAQFAAALRRGMRADGAHLYPAMPYTAYRLLNDANIHALYAYFMTGVTPVESTPPPTRLPFPFNQRAAIAAWNASSLQDGQFTAVPSRSAAWNRGAYLVTALGHCSACHSPRNLLLQEQAARALSGAPFGAWYAPNITPDRDSGIGAWSIAELAAYLGTGIAPGRARAAGGMAEVVEHSLSRLSAADLRAIAIYLKTVPSVADGAPPAPRVAPARVEPQLRGTRATPAAGAALYSGLCASCHGANGEGSGDGAYPGLSGDTSVGSRRADNLIAVILNGVDRTVDSRRVSMPAFGAGSFVQPLGDAEVATVASFVRARYGRGGPVTAADVATARAGGPRLHLPQAMIAAGTLAAIVVLLAWRRRRGRRAA